jgi:hypothetical protein
MEEPLNSVSETMPKSLKSNQLVVEKLGAELMIYDQARNQAFCLNQTAAFVWQHCDGKSTIKDIAAKMAQTLGKPVDEKIVTFSLQSLSKDGLLETSNLTPFVPASMSRRELIEKIGVRAAVALPLVTALAVATPRAHASSHKPPSGPPYGPPPKPKW